MKRFDKEDYIKGSFINIALYDVLDNDGMNKLIKRLYELTKKADYEVSVNYLKSGVRKLDYVSPKFYGRVTGSIGTVKFKNHRWLTEVGILFQ